MAEKTPTYNSTQEIGIIPRVGIGPIAVPSFPNQAGEAVARLGEAGTEFADKLEVAKTASNATNALSTYLTNLDQAKMAALKDQDWQNAPKNFSAQAGRLQNDALGSYNFDPQTAATLRLHMTHATITAGDEVQKTSFARGKSQFDADYETSAEFNQNAAATAGSPVARKMAVDRNDALIQTGITAGWFSPAEAAQRQHAFNNGLDHAGAMRAVASNPTDAAAALADPNNFRTLTPSQRETYREQAQEKLDLNGVEQARGVVAGKPYVASLIAGQFVNSAHVGELFEQGVVPSESGGRNMPPNEKGAFGPAQITPGFARDYAARLSPGQRTDLGDISKLSDQELTDKLMANPKLSQEIGKVGFHALAEKYGGNPVLALAAYNAGPERADRWRAAAEKQFGPNPTPEQILSVIDVPETQKYIGGIYGRAGARGDAFGVSPARRFQLGTVVAAELQTQETRDQHILDQMAGLQDVSNPVVKMMKDGVAVAPDQAAAYRSAQLQAAQGGSVEAARRLHEFDLAMKAQPILERAGQIPFEMLDASVNAAKAKMATSGATPDEMFTNDLLAKKRDAIAAKRMTNPVGLLVDNKIVAPVPLDTGADPGDPNFRAALSQRGAQAVMAQRLYGGAALALTPAEQESLKQRYEQSAPQDQLKILRALADTLPDAAMADTVQKVVGNAPGAEIAARFVRAMPDLAGEMLQGAQLLKTKEVSDNQQAFRNAISTSLKSQIYPTPAQQNAVIEAALYLDVARRNQRGALYDAGDVSGVAKALEDVTGPLTSRHGVQVAAPRSMSAGTFHGVLDRLDQADVDLAGGARDRNGNDVPPDTIGRYGILKQTAPGSSRYWVGMKDAGAHDGFQPFFTAGEIPQPLVFDMDLLASRAVKKEGWYSMTFAPGEGTNPVAGGPL